MFDQGIIEECESAWASPVVLVPKPGGGTRVCIDYRKLNRVTKPDAYSLPRIDDLLHSTTRTPYMSTMDLRAGYWQVPIKKGDQDKTAFASPFGLNRFLRMPFGLRNTPTTFQRFIDRFRSGLGNLHLLAYLDDLILLTPTFEDHLEALKQICRRLRQFQLRLNRPKCHFCCYQVKYLGHILSPEGLLPNPNKVTAIRNLPAPRNVKHLMSFIQTCSWFRRFIPQFAEISKPLTHLTKKRVPWSWSTTEEEAFERLKQIFVTAPILKQADLTQPFILRTDASGTRSEQFSCRGRLHGSTLSNMPVDYSPVPNETIRPQKERLSLLYGL